MGLQQILIFDSDTIALLLLECDFFFFLFHQAPPAIQIENFLLGQVELEIKGNFEQ
jgi:hypothetical protein